MTFTIDRVDPNSWARTGRLKTNHGEVETPVFVFAATQASVKSLTPEEFKDIGGHIAIANTYHLHLRPGEKVIEKANGLHQFMNWPRPLMTDSGGFQVLSLGAGKAHGVGKIGFLKEGQPVEIGDEVETLVKVADDGVHFRSHLDGSEHFFTPDKSMKIQSALGADMIFTLDECTSPFHDYEYTKKSLERSKRWAIQSLTAHDPKQALFGIVQGGEYRNLRAEAATFLASCEFDGLGIGGSLGKSKREMLKIVSWVTPLLPQNKPRHLLGIGDVRDLFDVIPLGIDLLDCVWPTRLARRGMFFLLPKSGGTVQNRFRATIRSPSYKTDQKPLDPRCQCKTCQQFSRSYIRHLYIAGELLGYRLLTYHNGWFFCRLMEEIRQSIRENNFDQLKKQWLS